MKLFVALPVMNEPELENTLQSIHAQTHKPAAIFVCVNQPESDRENEEYRDRFLQNQTTLEALRQKATHSDILYNIIDKSSPSCGWSSKDHGVGWARKLLFEAIDAVAQPADVILSLDADTLYAPDYFQKLFRRYSEESSLAALSSAYYHRLCPHPDWSRAMLRYEIYMRIYLLNLRRIGSPYAFTALGSALSVRVSDLRRMGGMAPKKSGEDFYLLQQLAKIARLDYFPEPVFPATRPSQRVFFGTGPAIEKGLSGQWESYPIYAPQYWDEIAQMFQLFETWFDDENAGLDCAQAMAFLSKLMPLSQRRKWKEQAKSQKHWLRFCHEKFDGLRCLQYLKERQHSSPWSDEEAFSLQAQLFDTPHQPSPDFRFATAPIEMLDNFRRDWAALEGVDLSKV